ncbi:hypothetical protein IF2G_08524 [Cordyceps javanica]|nr:hypothetical protein IF2G_08524 [Cordyceps javanica]
MSGIGRYCYPRPAVTGLDAVCRQRYQRSPGSGSCPKTTATEQGCECIR